MRNNQITGTGAQHLADLIRANKTLKRLDLRWNDIGRQGAISLLQAVQENSIIQNVELTGNKGTEEISQSLETFLQRNRGEIGGLGKLLSSAAPGSQNDVPYQILQREKDFADDLKAKYEAQVIAHARTEKKIKELEKSVEYERRKMKATNAELVRSLDEEKIARKSIEATLAKLKEDYARTDLDKDKIITDL